MLLHSSSSNEVPANTRAALDAAHEAIETFFLLWEIVQSEAKVWWVFNHRAFLEALCIGDILKDVVGNKGGDAEIEDGDAVFVRGKNDICEFSFNCMSGCTYAA